MGVYMDPSRNNTLNNGNSGNANPGVNGGRPTSEQSNPVQSVYVRPTSTQLAHTKQALQQVLQSPVSQQQTAQQPVGNVAPLMNTGDSQLIFTNSGSGNNVLGIRKKKNKIIMISLAVMGILLFVVLLCFLLMNVLGNSNQNASVKNSFNRYANYFIYGENESNDLAATYSNPDDSYFIRNAGAWESPEYLSTFNDLFNTFYNEYSGSIINDSDLSNWANNYAREVSLVVKYYNAGLPFLREVLDKYAIGGEVAAKNEALNNLQSYKDIGKFSGVDFYDESIQLVDKYLKQASIYDEMGCITNGEMNYSCALNEEVIEAVAEIEVEASALENDLLAVVHDSESKLYGGIFGFKKEIYSEQEANEEK